MAEEINKGKDEKKNLGSSSKQEEKVAEQPKEKEEIRKEKDVQKTEEKQEVKEIKKDEKKKVGEKKPKTEAVVNGKDLGISTKHAIAVCNFIRGKTVDTAISQLQEVADVKRAIPMKGELPHRKGMERGRYPSNAAKQFIKLLKQLSANATINGLDLEKTRIECKADRASRPHKRDGQRFKRTHVTLRLKVKENKKKNKEKK